MVGVSCELWIVERSTRNDGPPCLRVCEPAGRPSYAEGKSIRRPAMEIPLSSPVEENGDESGVRLGHRHP